MLQATREQMMQILKQKFPKMWIKLSEQFNGREGNIWTGEGSCHNDEHETPLFNYYDTKEVLYKMGVHKDLVKTLDKHGWYCEFYDAGTVFITQE